MLVVLIIAAVLTSSVLTQDFSENNLHRIVRTPQQTLLVPYPRVGKRSNSDELFENFHKRLYMARVGKRSYMYAPRIGK